MNSKKVTETSRFLSYVLRHEPSSIGLHLDTDGWASLSDLIAGSAGQGLVMDIELIKKVVEGSDKKRFTLSDDGLCIRAAQGHSTALVNVNHAELKPPSLLYHGTATRFMESINQKGLIPGARHHVHLSANIETAITVGRRHGKPVVLAIKTEQMIERGHKFFQADNGVWLTEAVSPEFFSELLKAEISTDLDFAP